MKSSTKSVIPSNATSSVSPERKPPAQKQAAQKGQFKQRTGSNASNRLDFLQQGRKPSSQAFPLLGSEASLSKDEIYDFENKLRDVIAELNKPIYDKIQDTLTSLRTIKGSQDEVNRKTKEIEFELQIFSQYGVKMDDLKTRIDDNETNIQQIYVSSQRKINTVQDEFQTLKSDFKREEEYSRISRKAADNLQQEYCKIVHSVASEKQRNLMYIEKAKREFVNEVTEINFKVNQIDQIKQGMADLEKSFDEKQKELLLQVETKLFESRNVQNRQVTEIKLDNDRNDEVIKNLQHQLKLLGFENAKIEREVQNTDFFLNKVQPISQFSQVVTMMRAIIDDEEQLERIGELQNQFFEEIAPDQEIIQQHLKAKNNDSSVYTSDVDKLEKVSPHYERVAAALKEVENIKKLAVEEVPSILMSKELEKFEGLFKKVQNHRDIVKNYEDAIDELNESSSSLSVSEKESEQSKEEAKPQVVFVQGKRATILNGEIVDNLAALQTKQTMPKNDKQRRSQSELQGGGNLNQTEVKDLNNVIDQARKMAGKKQSISSMKHPLALDLLQVKGLVGESGFPELDLNKNLTELQLNKKSERRNSGRKSNRSKTYRSNRNKSGSLSKRSAITVSKQMSSSENASISQSGVNASQISTTQLKELKQYEMTAEKYAASEQIISIFKKQFSIRAQVCDKVTAFKKGLTNLFDVENQRRATMLGTNLQPPRDSIRVAALTKINQKPQESHTAREQDTEIKAPSKRASTTSIKSSAISVRSIRGKIIKVETVEKVKSGDDNNLDLSPKDTKDVRRGQTVTVEKQTYRTVTNSVVEASHESKTLTKNEILASYIGQQFKLNEFHEKMVKNMLQDKAQQFEEQEEQSMSGSGSQSSSSVQDEMEALDSVHVDDIGSQKALNKGVNDPMTPKKGNSIDNFGQGNLVSSESGGLSGKRRSGLASQNSGSLAEGSEKRSKRSLRSTSNRKYDSQGILMRIPGSTRDKNNMRRDSSGSCMKSQMHSVSGTSRKSKRPGAKSVFRGGGGAAGGKMLEKHLLILKKEMEKKIKQKIEEADQDLSEDQQGRVAQMIQQQAHKMNQEYQPQFERLFAETKELKSDLEDEFKQMKELIIQVEDLDKQHKQATEEFIDQRERYNVAIRRMVKDKRSIVQLLEDQGKKVERNLRVNSVVHAFMIEIAECVNQLIEAEEINLSLYHQDEIDREQVVLYGLNEEAGRGQIDSKSPIQVNNNCLQCSGNASFIKKAFKIACLTYMPSKVNYMNKEYARGDLFNTRKNILSAQAKMSVEKLNSAITQEDARLAFMLEQSKPFQNSDPSQHLQQSYGDNNQKQQSALLRGQESMTTFKDNEKMMSFRDLNNSTMKFDLNETKPAQVDTVIKTTVASKVSRQTSPLANLKLNTGFSETKKSSIAGHQYRVPSQMRGLSATLEKKSIVTLDEKEAARTLPIVTPQNNIESSKMIIESPTTFHVRQSSVSGSIKVGLDSTDQQRRNFYRKAMSKTEIPDQITRQDEKSIATSGRKSNFGINQNAIMSGRALDTGKIPFSTIETAAGGTQRKSQENSYRHPRGSVNNLFSSPTNAIVPKKLDLSSGELSIQNKQSATATHVRRRTIMGAGAQSNQSKQV